MTDVGTEDKRHQLLWVDGSAGALVGVIVLAFGHWLSQWYGLPRDFVFFMGCANLAYGIYSLPLSSRQERPRAMILLLVVGNIGWAIACVRWAFVYADTLTILGYLQLIGEAIFVGGLGIVEWRWREHLRFRDGRPPQTD